MISLSKALLVLLLLGALSFSSCTYVGGSREKLEPKIGRDSTEKGSLVFGYIDMKDAQPDLEWILLNRVEVGKEATSYPLRVKDGIFFLENLPQGSYFLSEFGGRATNFFSAGALIVFRPYFYRVGVDAKEHRFKIESPGVYYLGTWKFKVVKGGFFERDKFDLDSAKEPGQKALVVSLLEVAKGTPWESKLRNYQKSLK